MHSAEVSILCHSQHRLWQILAAGGLHYTAQTQELKAGLPRKHSIAVIARAARSCDARWRDFHLTTSPIKSHIKGNQPSFCDQCTGLWSSTWLCRILGVWVTLKKNQGSTNLNLIKAYWSSLLFTSYLTYSTVYIGSWFNSNMHWKRQAWGQSRYCPEIFP